MIKLDVVIEIGKKSNIKYEFDPKTNKITVDRILYGSNVYPQNYGFIENTLDWDGDPLDVLIISDHSFIPGSVVPTRILGLMKMVDGGETDTKLIGVVSRDVRYDHINKLEDLGKGILNEIEDFFKNYKNLQNKKVEVSGYEGEEEAEKELEETRNLFENYKDMDKNEFVELMKSKHPEKYTK